MVCLKSAETLSSCCFSSARSRVACSCMVWLLPWHSTYIKLFKRNQSAIKCQCILWKIIHNGLILEKLCQSVLGVHFFETQCILYGTYYIYYHHHHHHHHHHHSKLDKVPLTGAQRCHTDIKPKRCKTKRGPFVPVVLLSNVLCVWTCNTMTDIATVCACLITNKVTSRHWSPHMHLSATMAEVLLNVDGQYWSGFLALCSQPLAKVIFHICMNQQQINKNQQYEYIGIILVPDWTYTPSFNFTHFVVSQWLPDLYQLLNKQVPVPVPVVQVPVPVSTST